MTESDLATLTLKKLGVVGAADTPDAADSEDVVTAYEQYYAELDERTLANWTMAVIPARCADGLAKVLAARLRPQFGAGVYSEAEFVTAERGLLRVIARDVTDYVEGGDYF